MSDEFLAHRVRALEADVRVLTVEVERLRAALDGAGDEPRPQSKVPCPTCGAARYVGCSNGTIPSDPHPARVVAARAEPAGDEPRPDYSGVMVGEASAPGTLADDEDDRDTAEPTGDEPPTEPPLPCRWWTCGACISYRRCLVEHPTRPRPERSL